MQGTNCRYHRDDVQVAITRDAHGRRRWPEEREAEMDSLFPGRYDHPLPC